MKKLNMFLPWGQNVTLDVISAAAEYLKHCFYWRKSEILSSSPRGDTPKVKNLNKRKQEETGGTVLSSRHKGCP
ncbi:hypothetical protein, partial [Aestuariivita boseongensis]|uniref:hypothetical protein n=1 Tax=Aestuariivita boseongensis TaxID=1470562 RepID=UPI001C12113B